MDNLNLHFLQACHDGDDYIIKEKYLGKVDINFCDPSNGHGLYLAATKRHKSTVNLLLQNGAIDSIVMGNSTSALHMASFKGYSEIATLLLEEASQPKVDLKNKHGETPLHFSAKQGFSGITLKLLEHGACPDSCTTDLENTPLHYAAQKSHFSFFPLEYNFDETIHHLLMASTQSENLIRNKDGEIFLTIAEKKGWLNGAILMQKTANALKKIMLQEAQPSMLNAFHLGKQKSVEPSNEETPETIKKFTYGNKNP